MKKALLAFAVATGLVATASPAAAFCGFYVSGADTKLFNNATQVVLMREGTRTVLSMANNYQGPPQNFAMVVPVPVTLQKDNVKTLPKEIFARVDQLTAPRLVEYWEEDPCAYARYANRKADFSRPTVARAAGAGAAPPAKDLGVKIEAQFAVGEYDVVVLSAKDSGGLDTWLRQEGYKIPDGAEPYLRPYVQAGSKFFVAKVDVTKVKFEKGMATLSPLRFHYDADTFSLPIRLGLMNSNGTQDLVVEILAKNQRYEVANYPNVTVPTNFDVNENARGQFATFYASLFDRAIEKVPKAIVTEYSWQAMSCDPCPTTPLSPSELSTLGADVLPSSTPGDDGGGPVPRRGRPGSWMGGGSGFTVTRLHARYGKDNLGEDLVFRAAPPIEGGREVRDDKGALEHGAKPGSFNNFQGRYAIRHPWTGPIACKNPERGNWGGPPGNDSRGEPKPRPATDLAFAPRGKMQLAAFIKTGKVPDVVALPGAVTPLGSPVVPVPPETQPAIAIPDAGPSTPDDAGATPVDAGAPAVPTTPAPQGCSCNVPGFGSGAVANGAVALGFAALASALRRRLRR